MVQFVNSNTNSSKDLFERRQNYEKAYPTSPDLPNPIDFRNPAYVNYGKLNNQNDFVYPDKENLKQVSETGVFALNFVADAFYDFEAFLKTTNANRLVGSGFPAGKWGAETGWLDLDVLYHDAMNTFYSEFVGPYLDSRFKHIDIKNFDSFLDVFLNGFLDEAISVAPITKTGLLSSRFVSPSLSGLCLELSTADHNDDQVKMNSFIESPNFEFYAVSASKFGFLVDKNAPWRVVANLNSPAMQKYVREYVKIPILESAQTADAFQSTNPSTGFTGDHWHSYKIDEDGNGYTTEIFMQQGENNDQPIAIHQHKITEWKIEHQTKSVDGTLSVPSHAHQLRYEKYNNITISDVFTNYYIPSHYFDIENLKVYLFSFYNAYVSSYPTIAVPEFCTKAGLAGFYKALSIRNFTRAPISEEQYTSQYGNLFWLKAYFLIRLREVGVKLNRHKKSKALEKISHIHNSLDFMSALSYIQIYLKQYY